MKSPYLGNEEGDLFLIFISSKGKVFNNGNYYSSNTGFFNDNIVISLAVDAN